MLFESLVNKANKIKIMKLKYLSYCHFYDGAFTTTKIEILMVAIIVDEGVVLESQVNSMMQIYKRYSDQVLPCLI